MKLFVQVMEARGLLPMDLNGLGDPYVRLKLGKQRAKTKVVKKSLKPWWDEEFNFRVGDLGEELTVSVIDEDKCFNGDFIGQVKLPLSKVLDAEDLSLGTVWYQLQPKSKKKKSRECGEICLAISLSQNNSCDGTPPRPYSEDLTSNSDKSSELKGETVSVDSNRKIDSYAVSEVEEAEPDMEEKPRGQSLFERMFQIFSGKNVGISRSSSRDSDTSEVSQEKLLNPETDEIVEHDSFSQSTFEESLKFLQSKDQGGVMPVNLPGGVILDKSYAVSPSELNSLIFSTNSKLLQSLADVQGTTALHIEHWRFENGGESLERLVTYIKAATKLIKAVKATEDQTYLKADDRNYAVLASVSTPDVPFGNSFRCEVLYCIMPGPQLPSEEQSSRLVISWRINFLQSTMMKGMIENGARQGLKDSYVQFAEVLSQNVRLLDLKDVGSGREQILASLEIERESDWKLACRFFGNFTVISSMFVVLYVTLHILLSKGSTIQGLEFVGIDLPDSFGEVLVCGFLVLQGERVLKMIGRFLQARKLRGSDHGVKAQGDGWLLTVALIKGSNLAAIDSSGCSDPYVVFTCNGKTKTSSIKFRALDPHWNEIFEFDAMNDPPSTMDIKVYDFDGPFDEVVSLGHAEVNFVKSNLSELADVWISLEGKLAQACQSKLHLRIFLNNTGVQVVSDYLTKMEKEVGKKINLRSPQANSAFQKLFVLPPEEFLINDFTCHLKRKMRIQGRLFLSPRIIGFYTNLFGHKTKFFFLWEDIEDIQVIPPSLISMGSPSLLIILRHGRGLDARHGAKSVDPDGKLKFHFQSFVCFNVANRTIMALWKARSLSPEQKMRIAEEESEDKNFQSEESGSFLDIQAAKMSEVFSSIVPVPMSSLMEMFEGGSLEQKLMEKVGCVDYSITPWESVRLDVHQRQIHYKFDRNISRYGGEVTSKQQRSPLDDKNGWLIEEVMALQGVLLGDYFTLHLRYQIDDFESKSKTCLVQVSLGIAWSKNTKHQKRITKNVIANSSPRLKEMFRLLEKEFA